MAKQHQQAAITLLRGDDASLVRDAVMALVDELVGDADRSLMVEEIDVASDVADERTARLRALVDAAQTPPFLTDRRVVVGRGLHTAKADELGTLSAAVAAPLDGTYVVLDVGERRGTEALPRRAQGRRWRARRRLAGPQRQGLGQRAARGGGADARQRRARPADRPIGRGRRAAAGRHRHAGGDVRAEGVPVSRRHRAVHR